MGGSGRGIIYSFQLRLCPKRKYKERLGGGGGEEGGGNFLWGKKSQGKKWGLFAAIHNRAGGSQRHKEGEVRP